MESEYLLREDDRDNPIAPILRLMIYLVWMPYTAEWENRRDVQWQMTFSSI